MRSRIEDEFMREGWHNEDHLILFDEAEVQAVSERYAISGLLPGYRILGLLGWDDFIVQDEVGHTYSVPTVPLDLLHLTPYASPLTVQLRDDERVRGKIKWYVTPVAFGGDPNAGNNMSWVSHEQHAQLVRWWNDLYRSVKKSSKLT
jgi:hypothetical protein